ncbi:hypothetical protein [Chitinimonas koreensis]|uniref:hypothetical protein n=1 Tax=Chitinimonas koreensis TaxID=356302 RepID=UPI00223F75D5|nr:hypothetical protein [Chitinimonas koreensis]
MHPPLAPSAWRAELKLRFERTDGRTVLRRRGQLGPLVLQKPLYPEAGRSATVSCCIRPAASPAATGWRSRSRWRPAPTRC